MASVDLVTKEDLAQFKKELIEELMEKIVQFLTQKSPTETKKYLKSFEVLKMLGISPGTLQKLRNEGSIPFSLDGGLAFYEYDDVIRFMEHRKNTKRKNNKQHAPYYR